MWTNPLTLSPLSIISLSVCASVSLPCDPALHDDLLSFFRFDSYFLSFSLFSTISPLLAFLRCPPINTPLLPNRVTDYFSMLYIPRRQQLLYILLLLLLLHPVCLHLSSQFTALIEENLNRCMDNMINTYIQDYFIRAQQCLEWLLFAIFKQLFLQIHELKQNGPN